MAPKKPTTFIGWFLTDSGRKFTFVSVCAGAIGCLAAKFLPNVLFLNKYQEILSLYKDGLSVPVEAPVAARFEKAMDLLEIPERERQFLKPFTVFGFDVFGAGTTRSRWGAIIGIPLSFTYRSVDSIKKSTINVNNEPVNWSKDAATQLLNALVLSENAQLFAIAREIEEKRSMKLVLDTVYPVSIICAMYGCGQFLNRKYGYYARPTPLRFVLYSLIGVFGFGLYSLFKDYTQIAYDQHIDKHLSEKHPVFLAGGLEYYSKTIERNIALRALLGKTGEKQYSVLGNENFFLRQKRLPLNVRKLFFESKFKPLSTNHVTS